MSKLSEDLERAGIHDAKAPLRERREPAAALRQPLSASTPREVMSTATVLGLQRSIGNASTTAYLQREEEDAAAATRSPVHDVIGKGGSSLDKDTRQTMEQHLGADLSDVKLHVDKRSTESVSAAAYTVGNDVVVNPDHFQAGTASAQRTLAHELTHVVQQRSGPVDGTPQAGGIKVSDPSDRFEREAESSADRLMSTQRQTAAAQAAAAQAPAAAVQRSGTEEEEPLQGQFLQRQAAGDEEKEEESSE